LMQKMEAIEKERVREQRKLQREEEAGRLALLALKAELSLGLPASENATSPVVVTIDSQSDDSSIPGDNEQHSTEQTSCTPQEQPSAAGISVSPDISQILPSSSVQLEDDDRAAPPIVYVSCNGDMQLIMRVEDVTCAHDLMIVETVLKGCSSKPSPVHGLLDAVADYRERIILVKFDQSADSKKIARVATKRLAMFGYTAEVAAIENETKATFDVMGIMMDACSSKNIFDWSIPCSCPNIGGTQKNCGRHSQSFSRILDDFRDREAQVREQVAKECCNA